MKKHMKSTALTLLVGALSILLCASFAEAGGLLPSLVDLVGQPMPSLCEALGRYPDEEILETDGGNTEVFHGVTETEFNTFSVYLSEKGATLADYQASGGSFSASIEVAGKTIQFNYDTKTLEARVTYPKGTYDERLDVAKSQLDTAVQLLNAGKTDEALSAFLSIPHYSEYGPAAAFLETHPEFEAAARDAKYGVGNYVTFGHYPQTSVGNDSTPIEWLVLAREGNKALLLSRCGLDAKPYNTEFTDITWENCTLRTWLNGTFLNKAFSKTEQGAILTTVVDNSSSQGYGDWNTNGGNNTQDQVFLLSYAEANKYLGVTFENINNTKSRVAPTAYAVKQGASMSDSNKTADGTAAGWWWLRSPGFLQNVAADVITNGSLFSNYVDNVSAVVCPALWINLESGIF